METAGGIAETFRNGTFLVTGSTGFLGKILTEKLLRSCPVKNIAILVRSKKGFDASQRVADIYKQALFDRLRDEKPDFMDYIKVIDGNIEEESLGLSTADRNWIVENVNFVFHCAATIKFNEALELATKINIQGTNNLLTLAAQMKNLKGFVHVSTAYSHCPRKEIREQYYPTPVTAKELKNMLGSDELSESKILENWPNTYTFTKAITEDMISTNENRLPISIFRPSIIGCTKSEPEPGWLENMNGPTGILTGVMVGFLRTINLAIDKVTDIIPADYTANALISVMWDTVKRHQDCDYTKYEQPKIYNYVSSADSPLTWNKYIEGMTEHYNVSPPLRSMWYGFFIVYTNLWIGMVLKFLLHRIPAAFVDFLLIISGKSPKMLKMYAKTEFMTGLLHVFTTNQWKFDNSNTVKLLSSLSIEDRNQFEFGMVNFDWKSYTKSYYYGIRKHILQEEITNLDKAISKNWKLFWLHKLCIVLFFYSILQLCWTCIRYIIYMYILN
ncbi:fatty acyl-CoA reductase wat [Acyrthosiphon pisum]|uniref:Fatty acyl-CoA reductase n=1 Tax=Acyrthosiphon pisum TaxID=7029 RepID=A0A8R1W3F8_ACYPI|nr:fatty acyl-CoA reductase wat [Acyrthosiphon pisum]|eukprot:XP_001948211.2 PREDICTED: fatty acyl-CoA reductase 1 [Acyrthosiphon pisum]